MPAQLNPCSVETPSRPLCQMQEKGGTICQVLQHLGNRIRLEVLLERLFMPTNVMVLIEASVSDGLHVPGS